MNIDETMSILRKILENEGDIPTKLLIFLMFSSIFMRI